RDAGLAVRRKRQRGIRSLESPQSPTLPTSIQPSQPLSWGQVFVNQYAVKQRHGRSQPAPIADLLQRRLLVVAHLHPLASNLLQPSKQRLVPGGGDAYRQRLDEHPHPLRGTVHILWAAGSCNTEHNLLAAAIAAQQHRPSSLDERV